MVQGVAGSSPVTHPKRVRWGELATKGPPFGRGSRLALFLALGGPAQGASAWRPGGSARRTGCGSRRARRCPVDVDRLEQGLIDEPTVRVVGVLVDVGGVGQLQGVVEVLSRGGVVAVVRGDPVLDGLQRRGDPVLLLRRSSGMAPA